MVQNTGDTMVPPASPECHAEGLGEGTDMEKDN
jgi:hypothetical protein